MSATAAVRSFINVRERGLSVQFETTNCYWCRGEWVCSACYSKSERVRASLRRTADKRDARTTGTAS